MHAKRAARLGGMHCLRCHLRAASQAPPQVRAESASQRPAPPRQTAGPAGKALTISSKNYSSWSLRGWLLARFAGLDFDEVMVSPDDADARKELLLLAPSIRVPCLTHDGAKVWNTLAIAQYLNEIRPDAGLMPADRLARAHCRSVCGEMNSGFANLRSALPMNLKAHFPAQGLGRRAARHRPHRRDLDRVPRHLRRPVPVRRAARHGRRDVRAGRHAVPDLRREARQALHLLLPDRSWRCPR